MLLALRRRWYLVVATLVLAMAGAVLAVTLVGTTYRTEGAVLLVPPGTTLEQRAGASSASGNPYLQLSGLTEARDIVIRSMSAKSTYLELCQAAGDPSQASMRSHLCSPHPSISFEVTKDYESNAPVVLITVDASSREDAVTTLDVVMDRVPITLRELQGGLNLRANAAITSAPVVTDPIPDVVHKDQIRAAVLVGGGVLALGLLVTGLVDGLFLPFGRTSTGYRAADEEAAGGDLEDAPDDTREDMGEEQPRPGPGGLASSPAEVGTVAAGGAPVEVRPGRRPTRRSKPAPVPDWGAPTEQELTTVGGDRAATHWD